MQGFVGSVLAKRFDGTVPTPPCHKEWWGLCTGDEKFVAIAAPRGFAKSTSITFAFTLAAVLFRERSFVLLVSDTEAQAAGFLTLIKQELVENDDIRRLFKLKIDAKGLPVFPKDSETEVVGVFEDNTKFRIVAKGSEQKLRGLLWDGKRPDLIICHEKDSEIYTPETGWIFNSNYPGAVEHQVDELYELQFSDGHVERVSGDHRFLTQEGWKFVWEMKSGDNVNESISEDTLNDILRNEKNLLSSITISQRLKQGVQCGLRRIILSMLLLKPGGQKTTLNWLKQILKDIARNILVGWQRSVQNEEQRNCTQPQNG